MAAQMVAAMAVKKADRTAGPTVVPTAETKAVLMAETKAVK